MIAPIMLACNKRYAKMAVISVETFIRYHSDKIYVAVDDIAADILSSIDSDQLILVPINKYEIAAKAAVKFDEFYIFKYDKDGMHDRTYSSLKPIIMDLIINDLSPDSKYVLSLDSDTLFSGHIMDMVKKEIDHSYLYLVARSDPRMACTSAKSPGSGFTMWDRKSGFVNTFIERFGVVETGPAGGSQNLINSIFTMMPSKLIKNPLLHFVSPDQNQEISDAEIAKIKPAYIHLHGANSLDRLKRFRRVFEG